MMIRYSLGFINSVNVGAKSELSMKFLMKWAHSWSPDSIEVEIPLTCHLILYRSNMLFISLKWEELQREVILARLN